jgi:hypothetical protein
MDFDETISLRESIETPLQGYGPGLGVTIDVNCNAENVKNA